MSMLEREIPGRRPAAVSPATLTNRERGRGRGGKQRLGATFPQREGGRLGIRQGKDAQEQERLAVSGKSTRVTRAADLHALCIW